MKTPRKSAPLALFLAVVLTGPLAAQNNIVTYQGRVQSGGSDFTGTGQFKFALVTTANSSAQAFATANFAFLGGVTGINVIFGGSGYVTPPAVSITGGGGSGATATAFVSGGVVTSIQVNNPGTGYVAPPTVVIAAPPPSVVYLTHWSNDGTSVNGSEPTAAVTLAVNNALFTARLGDATLANMTAFGAGLFTQPNLLLRIWFSDGTNGMALLTPPQPLTAAPYAAVAGSAGGLIGGTYSNAVTFNNPANSFGGSGASLTALNASQLTSGTVPNARLSASVSLLGQTIESGEITDGTIQPADVNAGSFNTIFWRTAGNAGTTGGTHFLGTTDDQPVEFKVGGMRAVRIENNGDGADPGTISDGAPNFIAGSPGNFVAAGVVGATISGGGATNYDGFMRTNSVLADYAGIGGGLGNRVASGAVAGFIGGGFANDINTNAAYGAVGGGYNNNLGTGADYATVGGGIFNDVGANADYGTIGGGYDNNLEDDTRASVISGGIQNTVSANSTNSVIGGGRQNFIGNQSHHTTIGGGFGNEVFEATYATISGGVQNVIEDDSHQSTIGGGQNNSIGNSTGRAVISGGILNSIGNDAEYAVIAGGNQNNIQANAQEAVIGGGFRNNISSDSPTAVIAGGEDNMIRGNSSFSVISGGEDNVIGTVSPHSVIAGGENNIIGADSPHSLIAGGELNSIAANAPYATIAGGRLNFATNRAFAAGTGARAVHSGSFVWADFSSANQVNSATDHDFTARAAGGYRLFTNPFMSSGVILPANGIAWGVISDRHRKKDITPVNTQAVLERLAQMPAVQWHYDWEDAQETPHLGTIAQDFKAAFYPGRDDKLITTQEFDGVALAAIQGLNHKVETEKRTAATRMANLEAENADLKQRLAALERLVTALNPKGE